MLATANKHHKRSVWSSSLMSFSNVGDKKVDSFVIGFYFGEAVTA
jgi:hypothetical protein